MLKPKLIAYQYMSCGNETRKYECVLKQMCQRDDTACAYRGYFQLLALLKSNP